MGVGLNTMLAAVGAGGVASSKIATSFQGISEPNDGEKAQQMADKSRKNLEALKKAKLNIRKIRKDESLTDRQKSLKINAEVNKLGGDE